MVTGTVLSGADLVGDRSSSARPASPPACARFTRKTGLPSAASPASVARSILPAEGVTKDTIDRGDVVLDPDLHAPDRSHRRAAAIAAERDKSRSASGSRFGCITRRPKSARASCCSAMSRSRPAARNRCSSYSKQPIAAAAGDRFVLRDTSAQRTIGGGRFLDFRAPARKRRIAGTHGPARARGIADPAGGLAALLEPAPGLSIFRRLLRDRALTKTKSPASSDALGVVRLPPRAPRFALSAGLRGSRFKSRLFWRRCSFHAIILTCPASASRRLRLQLEPRLPAAALLSVAPELVRRRRSLFDGAWARLSEPRRAT